MSVRACTYNVHGFVGRDRRRDPDRVARVLEEVAADLIALQEVDSPQGAVEVARIADGLGLEWVTGPTMRRPDGEYGNVLLSRTPPSEVRHHDLSVPGREPRAAIEARVPAEGAEWRVLATHLGLSRRERRRQAERLLDVLDGGDRRAVVLMGDFNEWWPLTGWRRRLRHWFGGNRAVASFPAVLPVAAFDRVWVRPPAALRAISRHRTPLARVASDHLPVVAEVGPPPRERPAGALGTAPPTLQ